MNIEEKRRQTIRKLRHFYLENKIMIRLSDIAEFKTKILNIKTEMMRNLAILIIAVFAISCEQDSLTLPDPPELPQNDKTEIVNQADLSLEQTNAMTNPDIPKELLQEIQNHYNEIVKQTNNSSFTKHHNSLDPDLILNGDMIKGIIRPLKGSGDTVDIAERKVVVDTSPGGNLVFGAGDIVILVNIIANQSNDDATDAILRESNMYQDANNFENKELIELDLLNTPSEYVGGYWDIETILANSYRVKSIVYIASVVSVPTVIFSNTTLISTLEREINKANNHATVAFAINP